MDITTDTTTASLTSDGALPTLGDRPSADHAAPPATSAPRRRRRTFGIAFAAVAALAATSAGSAAWATTTFTDVPVDHAFAGDISWMTNNGIAEGFDDGTFRPTDPVKRQSIAAFLYRYNSEIEVVTANSSVSGQPAWAKTANCPAGKRAIGGGGSSEATDAFITDSYPANGATGWTIRWESEDEVPQTVGQIKTYALCIPGV